MIEENFSEIDNDFLKIWSQYLLDGDMSAHAKNIEKLAELGQINAIVEYFRTDPEHINPVIDKNLNANQSKNFNVLYAKALRAKNREIKNEDFLNTFNSYKTICRQIDEDSVFWTMSAKDARELLKRQKSLFLKKDALEEKIKKFEFIKYLNSAASSCYRAWKETKDPVFLENFCEIGLRHRDVMFGENHSAIEYISEARKHLMHAFFKDLKNPATKFCYGKNLILFSKDQKKQGAKILKTIATSKTSDALKSHKFARKAEK